MVEVLLFYIGVVKIVVVFIGQFVKEGDKLVEMELDGDELEVFLVMKKVELEKLLVLVKIGNVEDQNSKFKSLEVMIVEKKLFLLLDKKFEVVVVSSY